MTGDEIRTQLAAVLQVAPSVTGSWDVLRHPLVYAVPYVEQMNKQLNAQLAQKSEAVASARRDGDWDKYVWLHEKPYRLDAFAEIADNMNDQTYWSLLADIWIGTENLHAHQDQWCKFMLADRPGREHLMDADDRKVYDALGDTVTIYRGASTNGTLIGPSWTLQRETAEWFAKRLLRDDDTAYLLTVDCPKDLIVAYFGGRNEVEVVVADLDDLPTPKVLAR